MCLAIPMQLIEREAHMGIVELKGVRRRVSLMLMPAAEIGDHLLIHAGCAIGTVDAAEAAETVRLLEELIAAEDGRDPLTEAGAAELPADERDPERGDA
jgi:hydrogenase expression/formation protein HypC